MSFHRLCMSIGFMAFFLFSASIHGSRLNYLLETGRVEGRVLDDANSVFSTKNFKCDSYNKITYGDNSFAKIILVPSSNVDYAIKIVVYDKYVDWLSAGYKNGCFGKDLFELKLARIELAISLAVSDVLPMVSYQSFREERGLMMAHCLSVNDPICKNVKNLVAVIDCHWRNISSRPNDEYNESLCAGEKYTKGISLFIREIFDINKNFEVKLNEIGVRVKKIESGLSKK